MARIVLGCGYLGMRVARRWLAAGDDVWAVTRSTERAERLRQLGLRPIVWDLTRDDVSSLPDAATVLFAVGFDRSAGHAIDQVYVEGLQRTLERLPARLQRFIYISSTGVYAQNDGQWVDEQSETQPKREGGRACLAAERLLEKHPLGRRAVVLRLAGIYGPGRIPRQAELRAGQPIAAPAHGYLNLIQVEDAADVVLAAETRAPAERLYTVSDGQPVLRGDYYRELARLLSAPPPLFTAPPAELSAVQRAASDKRVSNRRMLVELGVTLQFPTYREGLADAVEPWAGET